MNNNKKLVKSIEENAVKEYIKVNPFSLNRPEPKYVEKDFTDSNHPDLVIHLKLKGLDVAEQIACAEATEKYVEKYMGVEPDWKPQTLFPLVGGQQVTLSRYLLAQAVMLAFMQERSATPYTIEDFVGISVTLPEAWMGISKVMGELLSGTPKND